MNLILTISCAKDRGHAQDAIRETWAKGMSSHAHMFLLGHGCFPPAHDEMVVDVDDSYSGLTEKLRAAYHKLESFDHVFVSCIDTYIVPQRLLSADFSQYDFVGRRCNTEPHASGGNGYWLSRLARAAICVQPAFPGYADQADYQALLAAGIQLTHDFRIGSSFTKHLSRGTGNYSPVWMIETHKKFMEQPLD